MPRRPSDRLRKSSTSLSEAAGSCNEQSRARSGPEEGTLRIINESLSCRFEAMRDAERQAGLSGLQCEEPQKMSRLIGPPTPSKHLVNFDRQCQVQSTVIGSVCDPPPSLIGRTGPFVSAYRYFFL